MKKILLILLATISSLGFYAQDSLYVYRKGGHIEAKSVASVDSIRLNQTKDSLYIYQVGKISKYELSFVDSISFARVNIVQSTTKDKGVVINGVCFATRNVNTVGSFVTAPETYGCFYMWNRKVALSQTSTTSTSDTWTGGYSPATLNDKWLPANDPSPSGWRMPTLEEMSKLYDTSKVTFLWTTLNGVNGAKFTDKTTLQWIFLPAVGYRANTSNLLQTYQGHYWINNSAIIYDVNPANQIGGEYVWFRNGYKSGGGQFRYYALTIRPVIR